MSDYLSAAAEAMGLPEAMVQRSAEARAKADGVPVDDVLGAWAGQGTIAAAPAPAPPEEVQPTVEETPAGPPEKTVPEPAPTESTETVLAEPPVPSPSPEPQAILSRPVPESIPANRAEEWESVTTVPTVGLKERTRTSVPSWLTAAFVVLPLVGLLYLLQFSDGPDCGNSGLLAVDRATGEVVNCDGSPFEGRGAAGDGPTDFFTRGQAEAEVACNACHGNNGEGGAGPAFAGGAVLATFPTCADHVKWVQLGSAGWQAQVSAEYGAQGTLSKGGMPGFGDSLSDEDLRSVVLFERVKFGGADLDENQVDCGLVISEPPAGGEESPPDENGG